MPGSEAGSCAGMAAHGIFQIRMVVSVLPLARVLPSGLNATEETRPTWPRR